MHYQLFIPSAAPHVAGPALLEQVGLADFVAGAEFLDVAKGPDGTKGSIVAWRRPGMALIGYQPDKQTWLPAVPREGLPAARYWVGLWNDSQPAPGDLGRPYAQPGSRIALADGNEWLLPLAKELSADLILQDDGSWRFEIQRRFHAFYLEYLRWLALFAEAEAGMTYQYSDAADFVLQALRINYRLLPEAASHLRLFSTDNITRCMFAILGAG